VITAERWYDPNPDFTQHYQGDVVKDIPFPRFPASLPAVNEEIWGILRPLEMRGRTIQQAMTQLPTKLMGRAAKDVTDKWTSPDGEFVAAHVNKKNVMIISRSCSLDNPGRKHRLVAPIQVVMQLPEEQRKEEKLNDLRKNEIPHFFYLPAKDGLAESYADLLMLTPIHRSFFPDDKIEGNLVARLSESAMAMLQHCMSNHFGTQFGFDHEDVCPEGKGGRYSCSNCFHAGRNVQAKDCPAQQPFGHCPGCGEDAAWIKVL
jgi:hypothetical protein